MVRNTSMQALPEYLEIELLTLHPIDRTQECTVVCRIVCFLSSRNIISPFMLSPHLS